MGDFIAADCGIRQLHARFVDAVWRKDADGFAALFAPDGEWKIAGLQMHGRDEIGATFAKLLGACERVRLILGPPLLELVESGAVGRIDATELAKMADGGSAITIGVYHDRYVEEDGRWLFRKRHWSLHYRGPFELSAPWVPSPDYGPFPGAPGDDEPTLTRRAG